jgi:hypothetical protein
LKKRSVIPWPKFCTKWHFKRVKLWAQITASFSYKSLKCRKRALAPNFWTKLKTSH